MLDWRNRHLTKRIIDDLKDLCREQGSIFIKIDPEVIIGSGIPGDEDALDDRDGIEFSEILIQNGWAFSEDQIQFKNTMLLDLRKNEDEILAGMKQKSRYNLRIAQKKGVEVYRCGNGDLSLLYRMYAETSVRDGFVIRPEDYYVKLWGDFMAKNMAMPLIAKVDSEAVAGMVLFYFSGRAWYLHGMSRPVHRDKMPNYLIQWEAIRFAKEMGCTEYDLWGAPDIFDESDSMWNVFRFKEGLGAKVSRTIGAWDYTPMPGIYWLYTKVMPRVLNFMRRRGKTRVSIEVS